MIAAALLTACGGDGSDSDGRSRAAETATTAAVMDTGPAPSDGYYDLEIVSGGITATMGVTIAGGRLAGNPEVTLGNESAGGTIDAAPVVYVLDGTTGRRIIGDTVDWTGGVTTGDSATFHVTFPTAFDPSADLVGLEVGGEDIGGFVLTD